MHLWVCTQWWPRIWDRADCGAAHRTSVELGLGDSEEYPKARKRQEGLVERSWVHSQREQGRMNTEWEESEPGLWGGENREEHGVERGKQSIWITSPQLGRHRQAGFLLTRDASFKVSHQLQGVCTEGIGLRAVAHARGLYLHKAFLGFDIWYDCISIMLALPRKHLTSTYCIHEVLGRD